jgi:uncharacterized protein YhhL (DUF1145 family)
MKKVLLWLTIEFMFGIGLLTYGGLSYDDCPIPGIISMIPGTIWMCYSILGIWAIGICGNHALVQLSIPTIAPVTQDPNPNLLISLILIVTILCHIVVLCVLKSTCKEQLALSLLNIFHLVIQVGVLSYCYLQIQRLYTTGDQPATKKPLDIIDDFDLEPYNYDDLDEYIPPREANSRIEYVTGSSRSI